MPLLLLLLACFDDPDLPHPVASGEDDADDPADTADSADTADTADTADSGDTAAAR
jgi:hypothetical protein